MRKRTLLQSVFPVCCLLLMSSNGTAIPPLSTLMPFQRVEADPEKEYLLQADNGPWMILAASFSGEDAARDAHALALEIRSELKIEAYLYTRHYDFTDPVESRRVNRYNEPAQARHSLAVEFDEIAVMVGNYSGIDDPALEDDLNEIKHAQLDCLNHGEGNGQSQRFAGLRNFYRHVTSNEERRRLGPMGSAFATRNPDLPDTSGESGVVDDFIVEMNREVEHSLLDCPGNFSVRVATFRGYTQIQKRDNFGNIQEDNYEPQLAEAAEKANLLTVALRERGFEAYEFHDRNESVVCVGSFDSMGTPQYNGTTEINPLIKQMIDAFSPIELEGNFINQQGQEVVGQKSFQPRELNGIQFDMQPIPVQVPRPSISANSGGLRGIFN